MHSRVFVLSKGTKRITNEEAIFEMANNDMDYVIDYPEPRKEDIEWLLEVYPSIFKVEDNGCLSILSEGVTEYFKTKLETLRDLLEVTTVDSIKKREVSLYKLKTIVEDRYGFYFYTEEASLETLDSFLKDILCGYLDTTWNVVQTMDYHY